MITDEFRSILAQLLRETWNNRGNRSRHWLLVKTLQALGSVKFVRLSLMTVWNSLIFYFPSDHLLRKWPWFLRSYEHRLWNVIVLVVRHAYFTNLNIDIWEIAAIIRQCFLAIQGSPLQSILAAQIATRTSFSHEIRPLLVSEDMNEIYLFVTCLECLEPTLWAGTSSEIPAVLDEWEVERVMKLLHSSDQMIRMKVCYFSTI